MKIMSLQSTKPSSSLWETNHPLIEHGYPMWHLLTSTTGTTYTNARLKSDGLRGWIGSGLLHI